MCLHDIYRILYYLPKRNEKKVKNKNTRKHDI